MTSWTDSWLGFVRPDGAVGVRNHVLVVPGGLLPARICDWVPGVRTVTTADRGYGRTARDRETIARTLVGLGRNANVYGVIVWGGDPTRDYPELEPARLAERIAAGGKPVELVDPDRLGGSFGALERGVRVARALVRDASRLRREAAGPGELALGVKCGNSDVTSGQAGNPVVGHVYDRVVAAGGVGLFGETTETSARRRNWRGGRRARRWRPSCWRGWRRTVAWPSASRSRSPT